MTDVIIVGAGAAGLMAAYELAQKGKKVIVLEVRELNCYLAVCMTSAA